MRVLKFAGWSGIVLLFLLFNLFLMTSDAEGMLRLTLYSIIPIWVLTAVGGSAEIRAVLRRRKR